MTRHQYGISALVPQTSLLGETSDGVGKWRLFSQANELNNLSLQKKNWPKFSWVHNVFRLIQLIKAFCRWVENGI